MEYATLNAVGSYEWKEQMPVNVRQIEAVKRDHDRVDGSWKKYSTPSAQWDWEKKGTLE